MSDMVKDAAKARRAGAKNKVRRQAQKKVLEAAKNGPVRINSTAMGNSFSALAQAGLMTHSCDGTPEPEFFAYVIGSVVYITDAGRAAL